MRLIGWRAFSDKAGVGKTELWQRSKAEPDFPAPVRDGRRTLFVEAEIDRYLAARVARLRGATQANQMPVLTPHRVRRVEGVS